MVSHQMCLPYFFEEHHGRYNGHENHQTPGHQWHPQLDVFLMACMFQMAWVALSKQPGRVFKGLSTQRDFPFQSMVSTHSICFTVPLFVRCYLGMAALI